MSGKEFIRGIAFGAALGGTFNGIAALRNGRTFFNGTPKVQPITLPNAAGLSKIPNAEIKTSDYTIKSDVKLANPSTTTTGPTTQNNTAVAISNENGFVDVSNRPEFGIVDKGAEQLDEVVIKYHPRIEEATDLYHNFPKSFDEHIIQNGVWSQRIKDGANWFELKGSINGVNGVYQIGLNKSNVIFHKNFIPLR